jgi:hypothetical protein
MVSLSYMYFTFINIVPQGTACLVTQNSLIRN